MENTEGLNVSELTADIVAAYVSNNSVRAEDLAQLIGDVHTALQQTRNGKAEPAPEPQEPAVSVKKSVSPDFIVCLEDGKKFKSLKRHLQGEHGMTPAEYRAKWGLKKDYPMVAPNYSESRSLLARALGLGRKAATGAETALAKQGTTSPRKRAKRSQAA